MPTAVMVTVGGHLVWIRLSRFDWWFWFQWNPGASRMGISHCKYTNNFL